MKARVLLAVFACALVGASLSDALSVDRRGVKAETRQPTPGDINGDGKLDISDPVALLSFLFRGGEAPVAVTCDPSVLPSTGQIQAFDDENASVLPPCDGPTMPPYQDGRGWAGCPMEDRFVDDGDTVTDTCTGLVWQKNVPEDPDGLVRGFTWREALEYCRDLTLAGEDDWRLPNVRELESIVHYGQCYSVIHPVFEQVRSEFWSSTTFVCEPHQAWVVDFDRGGVLPWSKILDHGEFLMLPLRAVRGGQVGTFMAPSCRDPRL